MGGLKGDSFELRHLKGDVPGSAGEITVVVADAISLALLIALVPGSLGQLFRLSIQQLIKSFFYAVSHQLFNFPLITFSFSCTIFLDMVCCLLSNVCVAISFYQRSANHVSFSFYETYSTLSFFIGVRQILESFLLQKKKGEASVYGLLCLSFLFIIHRPFLLTLKAIHEYNDWHIPYDVQDLYYC